MKKLIGVRGLHKLLVEDLKRDLLIFDKVYVVGLQEVLYDIHDRKANIKARPFLDFIVFDFYSTIFTKQKDVPEYIEYLLNELKYLIEMGKIVLDYHEIIPNLDNDQINKCFNASSSINKYALKTMPRNIENENAISIIELMLELSVREKTFYINQNCNIDAHSIIENYSPIKDLETKKQLIARVAISKFPIPDEKTPWEQIFDFKNDSDSSQSLLGLRTWINKMTKSSLDINECEEEFEYLLNKYEQSIKLHKLKMNTSILETTIVGGAELIENLAKLKFGKIAKSLFKARKEQIELMEIELKSEGSELSYIIKANNEFSK